MGRHGDQQYFNPTDYKNLKLTIFAISSLSALSPNPATKSFLVIVFILNSSNISFILDSCASVVSSFQGSKICIFQPMFRHEHESDLGTLP